jgi:ABC-2 type transport system ATP-binding protein
MNPVLQVKNLTKKYKNIIAVDNASFDLFDKEIYVILGESKSGKSSIVKIISGLAKKTSGEIYLFGSNNLDLQRKKVGTKIEYPVMHLSLKAAENLEIQRLMLGIKDKKVVRHLLKKVGLDKTDKLVKDFSQSMRERMGIAMALMGNPRLVILDEPFDNMEEDTIKEIKDLILDINNNEGTTILITTNTINNIDGLASRIGVLKKGRIIKECTDVKELRGELYG